MASTGYVLAWGAVYGLFFVASLGWCPQNLRGFSPARLRVRIAYRSLGVGGLGADGTPTGTRAPDGVVADPRNHVLPFGLRASSRCTRRDMLGEGRARASCLGKLDA
jgi:hypothetical protein